MLSIMTRQMKLIIVVFAVFLGGCGKHYFDINNTNPNQVTNLPPMTLMAGVLNQTASIVTTDFPFLGCYQGYWTITQGFSDITDYANYNYSTNFGQNIWTDLYSTWVISNISRRRPVPTVRWSCSGRWPGCWRLCTTRC
jgi:hypothetical protein